MLLPWEARFENHCLKEGSFKSLCDMPCLYTMTSAYLQRMECYTQVVWNSSPLLKFLMLLCMPSCKRCSSCICRKVSDFLSRFLSPIPILSSPLKQRHAHTLLFICSHHDASWTVWDFVFRLCLFRA